MDSLSPDYLKLTSKTSTFVSVDVVGSTGLKTNENEQDVIYTFLAYQKSMSDLAYTHHGEVIHITGDGLMCKFQRADDASDFVESALASMQTFNKNQNRLSRPLPIRMGVHTGEVYESQSLSAGQLVSQTLDITAKLQQSAPAGSAFFSETTMALLKDRGTRLTRAGWNANLQMNAYQYQPTTNAKVVVRQMPTSPRLLVVEQDLDELTRLKRVLGERKQDLFAVYTPTQALLCLNTWKPHVMLLSLDLPWDGGWDFLDQLRADKRWSSTPVIAMSHEANGDTVQRCFKNGGNGFLKKPMDDKQILKRVEMVMREFYL